MHENFKIKRRRLNLKESIIITSICLAIIFLYSELTRFKSYVHRGKLSPRVTEYCSKFNKPNKNQRRRVAFLLIGTGKYITFANQLVKSMEKHFCPLSPHIYVHYFIFTDNIHFKPDLISKNRNFTNIYQEHLKWPMSTLLRFEHILKVKENVYSRIFKESFGSKIKRIRMA